jgi:hypothetical protein
MLIGFAVTILPVVVFTRSDAQPPSQMRHSDTASFRSGFDEIYNGIASIVGDPGRF